MKTIRLKTPATEPLAPTELSPGEIDRVSGGLDWKNHRKSGNMEDVRSCSPTDLYINPGSGTPASCGNPRFRN